MLGLGFSFLGGLYLAPRLLHYRVKASRMKRRPLQRMQENRLVDFSV